MAVEGFTVDLNKPIVFQVGHLGEAYQEWVHRPSPSKEGPRFFANDFFESLTHNKWWFVPLGWLPVVCWFISRSAMAMEGHKTRSQVALMVLYGLCMWTAFEYTIHRFLFHMKTKTYWGNTVHFLLHGFHHKHPMDGLRLVTPPAAVALTCFPFYGLARLLAAPALFGGWLLGYVIYDMTHYLLHQGHTSTNIKALKNFQKYHLKHHNFNMGFGVTSPFWDKVFGTLPTLKAS